jgi:hypothetical protein
MQIAAIIYILLASILIIAMFGRSRAKEGIPVFKLTQRDKADLREMRRELKIRIVLARLLGGFGSVGFFAGVFSLFHKNESGRADWITTAAELIVFGSALCLCAVLLLKSAKR